MSFRLRHESRPNAFGKDPTIWILEDDAGTRLDIWPELGFNAFRWTVQGVDLLDADPAFFSELRPSRSGFPILFPFPNRIRDGRFSWAGKEYALPLNCPKGVHAIHGFALNAAWTPLLPVLTEDHAELAAEFHGGANWPATFSLTVTYRLGRTTLDIVARVRSFDMPLPMGLGYHPYFRVAPFGGDEARVFAAAERYWVLDENLPTGEVKVAESPGTAIPGLCPARRFGDLHVDAVYTALNPLARENNLDLIAGIEHPNGSRRLHLWASPSFRELVVFTPPHRRSICLEPYACATDAINLQARGVDAGWIVLPPHQTWRATVHLSLHGASAHAENAYSGDDRS